ncbi:MAG: translational GTPase TypA [Patescibacteria group bacterium]
MKIRNIAIIAHVDHGKTTLVDSLLSQAEGQLARNMEGTDLIMDSNDLEKERGITIFSKNASVIWEDVKINIIDTPGHADFGGEVERVLSMADGCLLLVDAKEGPMPQTRFVLKKALLLDIPIIVVINKIDKPEANPEKALDETFELFMELGASNEILDFPIIYASSLEGKAGLEPNLEEMEDIKPLLKSILEEVPEPKGNSEDPLQLRITSLARDDFKGKMGIGKIHNGVIKKGEKIAHITRKGEVKKAEISSLMTFTGLERTEVEEAKAGDIVAISGIPDITIGETIANEENPEALPVLSIDQPTVKMKFLVNDSPFFGKESDYNTSRQLRERLYKELETDVALHIEDLGGDSWTVSGRGELHLAILIERMRREGYELQVGRPEVVAKEVDGKRLVPYELVKIEVLEEYSGVVIEKLGTRKGVMQKMEKRGSIALLEFIIPTKGLFGYRKEFLTDTKGLGIMTSSFHEYREDAKNWPERDQGSLVSICNGKTNLYGLRKIQKRGTMFLGPGVKVYEGQVVGQNAKKGDLSVNVCKEKELSNMRSKGDGKSEQFNVPRDMDLEASLQYIGDDELVEVTPKNIRIRKIDLKQ